MKKDMRSWAIKIRGRHFYSTKGMQCWTFNTRADALVVAESITRTSGVKAEPVRVRIRIEDVS
jgi:hypothetical protein